MLVEHVVQTVANSSRRSSTKSLSPADATGPQQVTPHSDGSQAGRGVLLDSLLETLCQHLPAFQWSLRLQTPHVSAFTRQQYMSVTNAQGLGHWRQTSDCPCLSSLKPAHPAQMRLLGCSGGCSSGVRHASYCRNGRSCESSTLAAEQFVRAAISFAKAPACCLQHAHGLKYAKVSL